MILNEALVRQNFISKILLKKDQCELAKELKAKVMVMRIALTKIKSEYEKDAQEVVETLKTDEFNELATLQDRTTEQEEKFQELVSEINEEYFAFLVEKGKEEVTFEGRFSEDEYFQIVNVNADNDVEINGNKLQAADFLEVIYSLFVE